MTSARKSDILAIESFTEVPAEMTAVVIVVCVFILLIYAVAPGRASEAAKAPFLRRNFAHRGLYAKDQSVPENSLAAFRLAAENGYGIELDVHITADDRLAVFHDDDLSRMCGVSGAAEDKTYAELSALRLMGTDEAIPMLSEVLAVIGGRVPIILEIKRGGRNDALCAMVRDTLRDYPGDVCIESFDPFIVRWWRKNAPEYFRGQLSATYRELAKGTSGINAFILSRLLLNFLTRPQFIAYGLCGRKPLTVRLCERMGSVPVAWTSHDAEAEKTNSAVIFEHYRPDTHY